MIREEVWRDLIAAAEEAALGFESARQRLRLEAAPQSARSPHAQVLDHREGDAAIKGVLRVYEREFRRLCAPHDYRSLLQTSRLCAGLPLLRSVEEGLNDTRVRCQTADYAAVAYGRRDLRDDALNPADSYESLLRAVTRLHVLASEYRAAFHALMTLSYLRLYAKVNGRRAPEVIMDLENGVQVRMHDEVAAVAERLFHESHYSRSTAGSRWGTARLLGDPVTSPAVVWMFPYERLPDTEWGGSILFLRQDRGIGGLYEDGRRFRDRFEHGLGMPPEHLCAILEGLSQLAMWYGPEEPQGRWLALTGTTNAPQQQLTGGALLAEAGAALAEYYPAYAGDADLGRSLDRFVALAAGGGGSAAPSLRSLRPAQLFLGEPHHDLWVVDYCASAAFIQEIMDRFQVTGDTATAAPPRNDAEVRTSGFDLQLAGYLEQLDGVELAFPELREKAYLPNVTVKLSSGGNQEIDVPLLVGDVFVAVQTWASPVPAAIDEGEYDALERRWEVVRRKLKRTDQLYGLKLMADPQARDYLRSRGVCHILPVFCTPHPEPALSGKDEYWLSPISGETLDTLQTGSHSAVPRILTPVELADFLEAADEAELQTICRRNGWSL
jgi:hypothetical protein